MVSTGMLRRVGLVRTDVSEELSASIIRITRISELGTTLAVSSNRCTLRRLLVTATVYSNTCYCCWMCWVESSCEVGNELSGSIKCWESTEWLHNLWALEWYSAPQS
jgi:hypothetical protein